MGYPQERPYSVRKLQINKPPLLPIVCVGKPSPDFLIGFPYLVSIQLLIFFVHMGYPQERPYSVRNLHINKPPLHKPPVPKQFSP